MRGKGGGPIPHHVEPKLFLLPNDVLVLSSGREGCYLWTLPLAELTPVRRNDSANDSLDDSHSRDTQLEDSPETLGFPRTRLCSTQMLWTIGSMTIGSDRTLTSAWRSCVVAGEGG